MTTTCILIELVCILCIFVKIVKYLCIDRKISSLICVKILNCKNLSKGYSLHKIKCHLSIYYSFFSSNYGPVIVSFVSLYLIRSLFHLKRGIHTKKIVNSTNKQVSRDKNLYF